MPTLIDFPQRQHHEFVQLVHKAVKNSAQAKKIPLEDYIRTIYYQGENPAEFDETHFLNRLYKQYANLIENAVKSVDDSKTMSNANKAYLCYRIYLHAMTIERNVMPETAAKEFLIKALREFFYAHGKMLSIKDELNLVNSLSLAVEQAAPF